MLTQTERFNLVLNALEDIYEVANTRQTVSTEIELNNMVLKMQALAQQALRKLVISA